MASKPEVSTIKKLSEASGVPNGTVGRACKGEVNLGIDYLEPLAAALGLEPWELLAPTTEMVPLEERNVVANPAQAPKRRKGGRG